MMFPCFLAHPSTSLETIVALVYATAWEPSWAMVWYSSLDPLQCRTRMTAANETMQLTRSLGRGLKVRGVLQGSPFAVPSPGALATMTNLESGSPQILMEDSE